MATGDKLVNLDVLKNTVQKEVVDLKSAVSSIVTEDNDNDGLVLTNPEQ